VARKDAIVKRALHPKPATVIEPIVVSDQTCFAACGLTPRQFRELLSEHPELPRRRLGHRLLVRADHLLRFVDASAPAANDKAELTVDEVLANLGKKRI
jgi:hypothetical protein